MHVYPSICSVSQQGGHLDDNFNPFVGDLQRKDVKKRSERILYFSMYHPHYFNILCLKVLKDQISKLIFHG